MWACPSTSGCSGTDKSGKITQRFWRRPGLHDNAVAEVAPHPLQTILALHSIHWSQHNRLAHCLQWLLANLDCKQHLSVGVFRTDYGCPTRPKYGIRMGSCGALGPKQKVKIKLLSEESTPAAKQRPKKRKEQRKESIKSRQAACGCLPARPSARSWHPEAERHRFSHT